MKNIKRELIVLGVLLVAAVAAVAPSILATLPVKRDGAFFSSGILYDSLGSGSPGGQVRLFRVGYNDSVFIGDVVYVAGDGMVSTSTTLAAYNAIAGVVVGGTRQTNMAATITAADVGSLAAYELNTSSTPEHVWILKQGRTWVAADATDSIYFGEAVIPSASSTGQMRPRTTAIDTFHRVFGRVAKTGAASAVLPVDVNVPR